MRAHQRKCASARMRQRDCTPAHQRTCASARIHSALYTCAPAHMRHCAYVPRDIACRRTSAHALVRAHTEVNCTGAHQRKCASARIRRGDCTRAHQRTCASARVHTGDCTRAHQRMCASARMRTQGSYASAPAHMRHCAYAPKDVLYWRTSAHAHGQIVCTDIDLYIRAPVHMRWCAHAHE